MGWADNHTEWFDLAEDIRAAAIRIVETASADFKPALGLKDPTVFAVTLLSRTIESSRAAYVLARQGFLVEAGMVARSCIEDVLWMRSLAKSGADFVTTIIDDGARADASIAELVKRLSDGSTATKVSAALDTLISRKTKVRVELRGLRSDQEAEMEYTLFRMLSNDYAHVSRSSLMRHIVFDEQRNPEIEMRPTVKRQDLLWTMFLAAGSVINAAHILIMTLPESGRARFAESGDEQALKSVHDRLCQLRDDSRLG